LPQLFRFLSVRNYSTIVLYPDALMTN